MLGGDGLATASAGIRSFFLRWGHGASQLLSLRFALWLRFWLRCWLEWLRADVDAIDDAESVAINALIASLSVEW